MESAGRVERQLRFGSLFLHCEVLRLVKPKRRRRFALPAHSILNTELLCISRAVRNDKLRAGSLEYVPRL